MIAAWMLFAVLTGTALSVAAAAAERVAAAARRRRRFVWVAAMAGTVGWPALALLLSLAPGARVRPGAAAAYGVHRLPAITVAISGSAVARGLDVAVLAAWALASAGLLLRLAASGYALRRWRRAWPAVHVDGERVRVSPDAGPAVVGLHPMEVVLPAWALALDRPLRALVLRHEVEHRAARDPYVLLGAALLTALAPWHLALWWQARRLKLAVEIDCDARVLRADPRPVRYAWLLLEIVQRRGVSAPRLAPALSASPSHLERRILAMHHGTRPTSRLRPLAFGAAALAAVAVACAVDSPERPTAPAAAHARTDNAAAPAAPELAQGTNGYFEFQVEETATVRSRSDVHYPDALRHSGIAGEVFTQFVVDENGHVDPRTLQVLRSTNPAFAAAAVAALPSWEFYPARVGGHAVRQLVQLPFQFTPRREPARSGAR